MERAETAAAARIIDRAIALLALLQVGVSGLWLWEGRLLAAGFGVLLALCALAFALPRLRR